MKTTQREHSELVRRLAQEGMARRDILEMSEEEYETLGYDKKDLKEAMVRDAIKGTGLEVFKELATTTGKYTAAILGVIVGGWTLVSLMPITTYSMVKDSDEEGLFLPWYFGTNIANYLIYDFGFEGGKANPEYFFSALGAGFAFDIMFNIGRKIRHSYKERKNTLTKNKINELERELEG